MRDTTLDLNQIKELADYVAKRSASVSSQPLQIKTFIKKYMEAYTEAFNEISELNDQRRKEQSENL